MGCLNWALEDRCYLDLKKWSGKTRFKQFYFCFGTLACKHRTELNLSKVIWLIPPYHKQCCITNYAKAQWPQTTTIYCCSQDYTPVRWFLWPWLCWLMYLWSTGAGLGSSAELGWALSYPWGLALCQLSRITSVLLHRSYLLLASNIFLAY